MKLAILFWCYKNADLCEDRVKNLRKLNPETSIYVLFGGEPSNSKKFELTLKPYIDDFFTFDETPPPSADDVQFREGAYWKYYFGDLLISSWYRNCGARLGWDTIIIVQWDMLILGSISEIFSTLQEDQILLSGLRPVGEVEDKWVWVAPSELQNRRIYLDFLAFVKDRYAYSQEPLGFVAIVMGLPRTFLEKFSHIQRPELGFMEYRVPIYAQIFGTPFCTDHRFTPWWGAVEPYKKNSTLRARPWPISKLTILRNLFNPKGSRVFHPYFGPTPSGLLGWGRAVLASFLRWREKKHPADMES